jgi:hypothetical protein
LTRLLALTGEELEKCKLELKHELPEDRGGTTSGQTLPLPNFPNVTSAFFRSKTTHSFDNCVVMIKGAAILGEEYSMGLRSSPSAVRTSTPQAYIFPAGPVDGKPVKRVLAVASGGGHWVQLCRLMPIFDGYDTAFLTTNHSNQDAVAPARFYSIRTASIWNKLGLVRMSLQVFCILLRERPDVIISTGAAVGYLSIRLGKWFGARTIWLDSIANVDTLSVSGKHARDYADLWLTQWPQLATPAGPAYLGAVL